MSWLSGCWQVLPVWFSDTVISCLCLVWSRVIMSDANEVMVPKGNIKTFLNMYMVAFPCPVQLPVCSQQDNTQFCIVNWRFAVLKDTIIFSNRYKVMVDSTHSMTVCTRSQCFLHNNEVIFICLFCFAYFLELTVCRFIIWSNSCSLVEFYWIGKANVCRR